VFAVTQLKSGAPSLPELGGTSHICPAERAIAGRYRKDGVIGAGGMACVYRCRDLETGVDVATKLMLSVALDPVVAEGCFLAENAALSLMRHENVVALREHGKDLDGTAYMVMDLVPGVSLNRILAKQLPYPALWSLIDQLLSALVHVHEHGVVHGDLTPANVLVEDAPGNLRVRLIDFGLSWHFGQPLPAKPGARPRLGPPPGCGTPGYMAPEQSMGNVQAIGPWTDLYSLGAVAYRLIAGTRPRVWRQRSGRGFLLPSALTRATPVRSDTPAPVVDFVMKLLERAPEKRAFSTRGLHAEWQRHRPPGSCASGSLELVRHMRAVEATTRVERPPASSLKTTVYARGGSTAPASIRSLQQLGAT